MTNAQMGQLRNALGEVVPLDADQQGIVRAVAPNGRLVVAPGQTIASAWGNTTYDQTMQTFASAADRTNQWPAPNDGALSWLVDSHTPWVYRAGAWRGLPAGFVASASGPASQTDCGASMTTLVTLNANVVAGRKYRLNAYAFGSQQTATGNNTAQVGAADLGTMRLWTVVSATGGSATAGGISLLVTAATTGARAFTLQASATAGVFRVTAGTCEVSLDDLGSA